MFLHGGRVGPSPFTKMNKVEIFLLETLIMQIGFRLPPDLFSTMYRFWEQTVTENYFEIKYSLYVADVIFSNFVDNFRNVGGAQAIIAKISFQEELFNLEQSGKAMPNRISRSIPPLTTRCQYISKEKKVYDYENREPKFACLGSGLLTHIFEIKINLGIDTGIVQTIDRFNMQNNDDRHKL
jgi:hypothetical protein